MSCANSQLTEIQYVKMLSPRTVFGFGGILKVQTEGIDQSVDTHANMRFCCEARFDLRRIKL